MSLILTVARRELRSYFDSAIAYVCIGAFLGLSALMFFSTLFLLGRADMRIFFASSLISPSALLAFLIPILTIRLIAEERKTGTIELLTTMPIRDRDVILGKFLGALGLVMVALLSTFVFAIVVTFLGPLDWGPVVSGYLGLILFSTALTALGVLCSTLSESQIIAAIVGVVVTLALYFVAWLHFVLPSSVGAFAEYISISHHLEDMARGVIDSRDVIYYVTLTAGTLFLAERSLARRHA